MEKPWNWTPIRDRLFRFLHPHDFSIFVMEIRCIINETDLFLFLNEFSINFPILFLDFLV